jgi:predicted site-specific integrase-resolvase
MDVQTAEKPKLLAGFITEAEFCQQLGITIRTARKWRQTGEGPPYATVGASIYYPAAQFQKWLQKRIRTARG